MNQASPAEQLAQFAAQFWRFQCTEFPLAAVLAGEATPDAILFREAPADHERRDRAAGVMLAQLDGISADPLTGQDRATHRLLRGELEDLRALHQVLAHLRPALLPVGPDFAAMQFANMAAIDGKESAERYLDRLATLPAFVHDLQSCLQAGHDRGIRYPRVVLEGATATVRATTSGPTESLAWQGPFQRSVAAADESMRRCAERAQALIRDELLPAWRGYADFLSGPLAVGARSTIACTDAPMGREFYQAQLRHYTTTAMPADEIHQLGLAEIARLDAETAAVAAQAGYPNDVRGYRAFLASDPQFIAPSKEALLEQAESLAKRIDKKIPALFGRIPRMTYGIECMPESLAAHMPAAYAQPNPADRTAPGIYWLTSIPAKCPSYLQLPFALHEGWPGHLMHLALMQEMEGLPAFRRHGAAKYSACLEGWALYCETLGVEMGLYQTPHQHYGRLEMETWRAARLVVDTGIHWHGWSRERAVDYMAQRLAMARAAIASEVDRYIALPGQALAYQIGNLQFRSLRRLAERELGNRFDRRAFHDELMAAGPVSLPVLRELIEDWLSRQRHAAPR